MSLYRTTAARKVAQMLGEWLAWNWVCHVSIFNVLWTLLTSYYFSRCCRVRLNTHTLEHIRCFWEIEVYHMYLAGNVSLSYLCCIRASTARRCSCSGAHRASGSSRSSHAAGRVAPNGSIRLLRTADRVSSTARRGRKEACSAASLIRSLSQRAPH